MSASPSPTISAAPPSASPAINAPTPFAGDEFSNNLFSDLAPILTLFGEQVTKQFLSTSTGWADHVLLGCGPLGILTAVVSAIRVGGERRLKALIGRARESRVTAEQELLSSTSSDVCELWNEREIVRQIGQAKTVSFIYAGDDQGTYVQSVHEALKNGSVLPIGHNKYRSFSRELADYPRDYIEILTDHMNSYSPNLTLNLGPGYSKYESYFFAILAVSLQSLAIIFPALATFSWHWQKNGRKISSYAYPCFFIGTLAVTGGVSFCSWIIDFATEEATVKFNPSSKGIPIPRLAQTTPFSGFFHIQRSCTIGDEEYPLCIIFNDPQNHGLRISRLSFTNRWLFEIWSVTATVLAVIGFICQFIGLRALHWSASIVQLGVTLVLTAARSWARRSLARHPKCIRLQEHSRADELHNISMQVGALILTTGAKSHEIDGSFYQRRIWEIPTGSYAHVKDPAFYREDFPELEYDPFVGVRRDLMLRFKAEHNSSNLADSLSRAIYGAIHVWQVDIGGTMIGHTGRYSWLLPINSQDYIPDDCYLDANRCWRLQPALQNMMRWSFRVNYDTSNGYSRQLEFRDSIESILSLWITSLQHSSKGTEVDEEKGLYLRAIGSWTRFSYRTLGELCRWIGDDVYFAPSSSCGLTRFGFPVGFDDAPVKDKLIQRYPVFGYSSWSHERMTAKCTFDVVLDIVQSTEGYQVLGPDVREQKNPCFFTSSKLPLKNQCALEIFSGLIDTFAQSLSDKNTQSVSAAETTQCTVRASQDLLINLAQVLVKSDLVNSTEEANAIIIPPFATRDLLPPLESSRPASSSNIPDQNPDTSRRTTTT